MLASCEATVLMPDGVALHARPAGLFVRTAGSFRSEITVSSGGRSANAKSILSVMALGARGGTALELRAEGEDAERALTALTACVSGLLE